MTITRRSLGLGAACLMAVRPASAFEMPSSHQTTIKVMRKGKDIGRVFYDFHRQQDTLTVSLATDLRVKLGFITMFRYVHANTEIWQGTQLLRFTTHTDDNGTPQFATATWDGKVLNVTGSKTQPYAAPANALGTSYWNPRTLTDPLINSQNGHLLATKVVLVGPSAAVQADGSKVAANQYTMSGEMRANLWYAADGDLAGLQYYAHDGSVLTYEKM